MLRILWRYWAILLLILAPIIACNTIDSNTIEADNLDLSSSIVVKPGESIQAAIDAAEPGSTIVVLPGTYQESAGSENALAISKNGIRLIGTGVGKVILESMDGQENGIVITPEPNCSECHLSLRQPSRLRRNLPPATKERIDGFEIKGFTIKGFENGIFTRRLDNFRIVNNVSIDNKEYGIFPTLSSHGLVANNYATGSDDSGIWIETSEDVVVRNNLVEGNVFGLEISNSKDILMIGNESRNNTTGIAVLLLPFFEPFETSNIVLSQNWVHDNNRENTANPAEIRSAVPSGTGIMLLGADESLVKHNRVANNDFAGIAITDLCLVVQDTPFACPTPLPDGFSSDPQNNVVVQNILRGNGINPPEDSPFSPFAADLVHLVFPDGGNGNCFDKNKFTTSFPEILPACP